MDIIAYDTFELDSEFASALDQIISGECNTGLISKARFALAKAYKDAIIDLSGKAGLKPAMLDAIGIHGQTVWHQPKSEKLGRYDISSTYQIVAAPLIAYELGIPVVFDFRSADIAAGGQGAPLIPIFDKYFLKDESIDSLTLNIGGIANLTYLPKENGDILAFDTGPGNVLIDLLAEEHNGLPYDKDGEIAKSGSVLPELFNQLKQDAYIYTNPPKSTGREYFNEKYIENAIFQCGIKNTGSCHLMRTFTEFTVWSIVKNIELFTPAAKSITVSGGGLYNKFMMERLKASIPLQIRSSEESGIPSDAKEALCFAWLAYRRMSGLHGNIPSATGAKEKVRLGSIALP